MVGPRTRSAGVSLLEAVVIMGVMAIMAGALAPVVSTSLRKQKLQRARVEVGALRDAIVTFMSDVREQGFSSDASLSLASQEPVYLAVGNGDIPEIAAGIESVWRLPVDSASVDFLERHLATNRPGGVTDRGYATWRGAYLTSPIPPDPWGNRYMVNSMYLWGPYGLKYDTVVLSAGPNEMVESQFTQDGFMPGGDDIVAIVSSGRGVNSLPE